MSFPALDQRRSPRFATNLKAWLRSSGKARAPTRIVDLSTHGCRIDEAWGLILDAPVWLTLGSLQALQARVVWTHYSFAGLEFEVPLNEAVLDSLLRNAPPPADDELAALRETSVRCRTLAESAIREDTAAHLLQLAQDCQGAATAIEEGGARP